MKFSVGGLSHWVVMLLTAGLAMGLIRWRRSGVDGAGLERGMVWVLSAVWPCSLLQHWYFGTLSLANALPLHLCDIALLTSIVALARRHPLAVELTYYFGLAGTSHGLMTPALRMDWPHPAFFTFFAHHAGVVLVALYLVLGVGLLPRPGSAQTALFVACCYTVVVGGINHLLGTNYGFLCAKPPTASLMDHFGPWPWYIGTILAIAGILFALLYLPVEQLRKRKKADASTTGASS